MVSLVADQLFAVLLLDKGVGPHLLVTQTPSPGRRGCAEGRVAC